MRRANISNDDAGAAALEFLLVGLVLFVPLVYLVVALGQIQSGALGVEASARQLARVIATAPDASAADARAAGVMDGIAAEYGLDPDAMEVDVTCVPAGAECPRAGAMVRVSIRLDVPLPLVPVVWGLEDRARVPVEAVSVQKVSRLWGTP